MTVSIRPHHLLCMLTYMGKGYSPEFVSGFSKIIRRLNSGEAISLITGPDEICQPMLNAVDCHCHNDSVCERDKTALQEIGTLLIGKQLSLGQLLIASSHLPILRQAFQSGDIRTACNGCEWFDLCSKVAQNDFRGCRFQLPPN
ncbi:MAG: DUF1284 domain-containing protein [Roseibium sp.]